MYVKEMSDFCISNNPKTYQDLMLNFLCFILASVFTILLLFNFEGKTASLSLTQVVTLFSTIKILNWSQS